MDRWPLDRLKTYARNPRTHSAAQVAQIVASVRAFGWTNPLLVAADGTVIAGHGRLLAARELGLNEVPVIVLPHLDEDQRRALVIADNQIALNAGWDEAVLRSELEALRDGDFDLAVLGFSTAELDRFTGDVDVGGDASDTSPKLGGLLYRVVVDCTNERDQAVLLERLESEGRKCQALIS